MPRRCVDTATAPGPVPGELPPRGAGAVLALGVLLLLAACGSAPTLPPLEQYPAESRPAPAAPPPAATDSTLVTQPLEEPKVAASTDRAAAPETTAAVPERSASPAQNQQASAAPRPPASSSPAPIAPLTLGGAADVPPAAQQQFEQAVALAQSGDAAAAERAFDTLNAQYPNYAGPLVNLAILRAKAGKLEAAEQALQAAIERNPDSANAFNQLGILYRRLGRFKEADTAYQRAVQIDPNYANAWLNLGVLCDLYLQQPQRALEAFERYLQLAGQPNEKVSGWVKELKSRIGNSRAARSEQ